MTIQQFADLLKQENGVTLLLQNLQALRKCSLEQVRAEMEPEDGWIPWGVASASQTNLEPQS